MNDFEMQSLLPRGYDAINREELIRRAEARVLEEEPSIASLKKILKWVVVVGSITTIGLTASMMHQAHHHMSESIKIVEKLNMPHPATTPPPKLVYKESWAGFNQTRQDEKCKKIEDELNNLDFIFSDLMNPITKTWAAGMTMAQLGEHIIKTEHKELDEKFVERCRTEIWTTVNDEDKGICALSFSLEKEAQEKLTELEIYDDENLMNYAEKTQVKDAWCYANLVFVRYGRIRNVLSSNDPQDFRKDGYDANMHDDDLHIAPCSPLSMVKATHIVLLEEAYKQDCKHKYANRKREGLLS